VTTERTIAQLHRLAATLERARDDARAEGLELDALLAEAARELDAMLPALTAAPSGTALAQALQRVSESQLALERALHEELAQVSQRLDQLGTSATAKPARAYRVPAPRRMLDRVG
jgi:hypothetical protein